MKMLANVRIALKADGRCSLKVDGVEMAGCVLADSLLVSLGVPGDPTKPAMVSMTLLTGDLDVVVEDAEVEVVEPSGE